MKIKKTLSLVSKILFNVTAVLLGFTVLLSTIITNETVSTLLTQQVFKDKPEDVIVNTGKEPVRYKTWYSSVEDTLNGNGEIAWLAQAEARLTAMRRKTSSTSLSPQKWLVTMYLFPSIIYSLCEVGAPANSSRNCSNVLFVVVPPKI